MRQVQRLNILEILLEKRNNMKVKCVFCGRIIDESETSSAEPLRIGRCCYRCNLKYVIPTKERMYCESERKEK